MLISCEQLITKPPDAVFCTGSTASNAQIMAEKYCSLVVFAYEELLCVFNGKRLFQITQVLKVCNLDSPKHRAPK